MEVSLWKIFHADGGEKKGDSKDIFKVHNCVWL